MKTYRRWLRQQLTALDELAQHPDPDADLYDGIADVIAEARKRAAVAGLPDAIKACRVRRGGLTVSTAREILAACLAAIPGSTPAANCPLSVQQAAAHLNISTRKVYELCQSGKIRHSKNPIRISPADLEDYQRASKIEPAKQLRHLRR